MSLNWDISDCADVAAIKADGLEWTITETMIFATVFLGIPKIQNEADAQLYAVRMRMWENSNGNFTYTPNEGGAAGWTDRLITLADVRKRIGLSTNASRLTDAQFAKRLLTAIQDRAQREIRNENA